MVDLVALAVSHGLLALMLWRLLGREDLDSETSPRRQWEAQQAARRAADAAVADQSIAGRADA